VKTENERAPHLAIRHLLAYAIELLAFLIAVHIFVSILFALRVFFCARDR
jgi:hypothetical protein